MTIREQNNKPKNEISRKVFLALSSNVVVTLFGLISLFFIKRYMGYEALGIFAFAMAYVSLFKIFGDLGFSLAHTKRVSEGMELGKCHGTFFTIKIALTVFMGIVIFLFIISQNFFGSKMDSQLLENTIYLSILWVMIFNLNKGFRSAFTAKKEIAKNRIPRIFGRFIIMIMKVTIAVYGFSVLYLIGAEILGTLIILIIYIYLFRNEPVSKPTRKYIDKYRSFALPVMFLSISFTIMNNLNRVMIGLFVDTSGVGYYYLAQRLTEVFAILGVSIVMVVFPYVSEFASRSEFTKIRNLTSGIERHICLLLFHQLLKFYYELC